jgi:hypothetical protein
MSFFVLAEGFGMFRLGAVGTGREVNRSVGVGFALAEGLCCDLVGGGGRSTISHTNKQ